MTPLFRVTLCHFVRYAPFPHGYADTDLTLSVHLIRGGDAIVPIPLDRWDSDRLLIKDQDSNTAGPSGRFGGLVAGWAEFDAAAFGISPSEAFLMDPQQRVLLEVF